MTQRRLVFLSGAGGVGKTTTGEYLVRNHKGPAIFVQSSTRDTYKRLGMPTESQALVQTPQEFILFQEEIFKDYCAKVSGCLKTISEANLIIVDRTPYDHISYLISKAPYLTLDYIQSRINSANYFIQTLTNDNPDLAMGIAFFPFPRPWSESNITNDGQRLNKDGATYAWSTSLHGMLTEQVKRQGYLLDLFVLSDSMSIEQTALEIFNRFELPFKE